MLKCSVCESELNEEFGEFCEVCGWDLEGDLALVPMLNRPSEEDIAKYRRKLENAKKHWNKKLEEAVPKPILVESTNHHEIIKYLNEEACDETTYSYFRGDIVDGKAHGYGELREIYKDSNGESEDQYQGQFFCGKRQGEGKLLSNYSKEHKYFSGGKITEEGNFFEGRLHGEGKWVHKYADGGEGIQEGNFFEGTLQGKGKSISKYADGTEFIYEGNFFEGQLHGEGKSISKYADGTEFIYEGNFFEGQLHGEGKSVSKSADGTESIDEGNFFEGQLHGEGKWVSKYADGTEFIYEGNFFEGQLHGEGKSVWKYADGTERKEEGNFIGGKYQDK